MSKNYSIQVKGALRASNGGALGLIVSSTFVLVAVASIALYVLITLGGQRELSDAVDAGTLNTANQAAKVRITPSKTAADVFADCLADDGTVGLDNINKVQSKALLMMLNSRSMNMTGKGTASSDVNFTHIFNAARSINDQLADALNEPSNLTGYFSAVANANSVRMINDRTNSVAPVQLPNWQTACLNRGEESNMQITRDQLPPHINLSDLPTKHLPDGKDYLQGYSPIDFGGGKTLNFVSFENNQQSHLVSLKTHEAGTLAVAPIAGFPKPVPNTYKCAGESIDRRVNSRICWSAAISNQRNAVSPSSIDDGFIHIKLKQDGLRYFPWQNPLLGLLPLDPTKKSATSKTRVFPGLIGGPGILIMRATNGAQYSNSNPKATARTLLRALYWQGGDSQYEGLNEALFARANQIKPGIDKAQLKALLQSVVVPDSTNTAEYWIALNKNNELKVFTTATLPTMSEQTYRHVLADTAPDGKRSSIVGHVPMVSGNSSRALELTFSPFPRIRTVPSGTLSRHEINYRPGTGLNGNLLEIEQRDQTFVFTGRVPVPAVDGTAVPPCGCVH